MLYYYLNNKILPEKEAKISVNDLGFLRGYAVFDFLRCLKGKPFLLDYHLDRLENSARLVGLKIPYSRSEIKKTILKLLVKNNLKDAGVRIFLTGGVSTDGITPSGKPTFLILVGKIKFPDKSFYKKGIKLITYENQRELFSAKTTDYITLMSKFQEKNQKKALEILYIQNDQVLEGATCNFFLIKGESLITANDNILLGTRRRLILELAKNDFKIEERPIKIEELKSADEAFISSTTRDILPVVQIDNLKIGQGKVGQKTQKLMKIFQDYLDQNS